MLMKAFTKIDRFWLFLILVMLILVILGFFTLRGIFSAVNTAGKLDEQLMTETHVNQAGLDEAYEAIFNKKELPLDFTR